MEAKSSSETSIDFQRTTWTLNPEDKTLCGVSSLYSAPTYALWDDIAYFKHFSYDVHTAFVNASD
jgi:hypothetical protein